jgi:hypothetical protein
MTKKARLAIYEYDEERIVVMDVEEIIPAVEWEDHEVYVKPAHPILMPSGVYGVIYEREDKLAPGQFLYYLSPAADIRPEEGGFYFRPNAFTNDWVQQQGATIALYIVVALPGRTPLIDATRLLPKGD